MRQTDLETRHLPGYHGFSIYGTAPILPEHLQFCEEQQQGVVNLSQAPVLEDASQHQENGAPPLYSKLCSGIGWYLLPRSHGNE
jgi:hypothetical protein